jgi:hypothetical protein
VHRGVISAHSRGSRRPAQRLPSLVDVRSTSLAVNKRLRTLQCVREERIEMRRASDESSDGQASWSFAVARERTSDKFVFSSEVRECKLEPRAYKLSGGASGLFFFRR